MDMFIMISCTHLSSEREEVHDIIIQCGQGRGHSLGLVFFPEIKQNRMITLYCPNLDISESPGRLFIVVPGQAKIVGGWWPTQQPCSQTCQPFIYLFKISFPKGKMIGFSISSGTTIFPLRKEGKKKTKQKSKEYNF